MTDITLRELAAVAERVGATIHISLDHDNYQDAVPRRHVQFVSDDGAIGASDPDIDVAARAAVKHLETYTRPDGGVDWIPKGPSQ